MNKIKLPKLILMLALVAGFCMLQQNLNAQQDRPATQEPPDAASQQAQTMTQAGEAQEQMFTGKITKAGGKYVLRDTANKAIYVLDDQEKAKQFEGQEVKVSGTLDSHTKTIRVASISPES